MAEPEVAKSESQKPLPTNGAELLRLMRNSGTGSDKLAIGERLLRSDRKASLVAMATAYYEALPPSHVTLEKIRQLIVYGDYQSGREKPKPPPIEDEILGPPPGKVAEPVNPYAFAKNSAPHATSVVPDKPKPAVRPEMPTASASADAAQRAEAAAVRQSVSRVPSSTVPSSKPISSATLALVLMSALRMM